MIKGISIIGLGPHRDFQGTCKTNGVTLLSGPSEAGKSFVLEAILLALWGQSSSGKFQPEAIHDDFTKAIVELTMTDGRIIRRSITRTRSTTRIIVSGGGRQTYSNEADFLAAIGPLGQHPELLRLVLLPFAWQPLVAGNARKFRDLLGRILPGGDVAAEIKLRMKAHSVSNAELAWTDKQASDYRRRTRKTRDHALGKKEAAHERVAALQAGEILRPEPVDRAPLEAAALWEAYDRRAGSGAVAVAQQTQWDRQRAALGEPPEAPAAADVESAAVEAQRLSAVATQTYQEVYGRYQTATAQQQTFGALPDPSICPMCQRPGWAHGAAMAAQAQANVMTIQQEFMTAQQAHQQAHAQAASAQAARDEFRKAKAVFDAWNRSIAALGERPTITAQESSAPSIPRPDPELIAAVRAAERAAIATGGARTRWVADLEAAKALVETEAASHSAAEAEAKRADLLVDAIRMAPSAVAGKQAEGLGDLGPVSLSFGDNPAVSVLIDSRPYWLASRGRQVVADVWLRAGIRRALGVESMPIAVDNIQDVGGQPLPEVPPAIHMRTTDSDRLTVT